MTQEGFEYLDNKQWSEVWERYMEEALMFDPMLIHDITCIVPLPDDKLGVLVFTDTGIFYSDNHLLTTLYYYSSTHGFPDYLVLVRVFKEVGIYGGYKFPWICPYFCLFPLESPQHGIWINPLKIDNIIHSQGQFYARMINGLTLILPVHRRRLIAKAESACIALATIRRGNFHLNHEGDTPITYLEMPNTPFSQILSLRPILQKFQTVIGQLNRIYNRHYSLYHLENIIDDPDELYWVKWR